MFTHSTLPVVGDHTKVWRIALSHISLFVCGHLVMGKVEQKSSMLFVLAKWMLCVMRSITYDYLVLSHAVVGEVESAIALLCLFVKTVGPDALLSV